MRALAGAIASNLDEVAAIRRTSEFSMQLAVTTRYESAIAILSQYCDVDEYYIEYASFIKDCLDRLIRNQIGSTSEKLRGALNLTRDGLRIIDKCFESKSYSNIDVDAIAMRINILVSLFRFIVLISQVPESDSTDISVLEIGGLARNLSESVHAILSLAGDEPEVTETAIEGYEVLIEYSAAMSQSDQLFHYCSRYLETLIVSIKKQQPVGAAQFADFGDYLFCVGSILVNYKSFYNSLSALPEGILGLTLCVSAMDRVYSDMSALADASGLHFGPFELGAGFISGQSAAPYILLMSLRFYQIALQLWERQSDITFSLAKSHASTSEDILAVNYNLICIGWMMGDEAMSKHYMSVCISLIGQFYSDIRAIKIKEFIDDVESDRDLRGLSTTFWFEDSLRQKDNKEDLQNHPRT